MLPDKLPGSSPPERLNSQAKTEAHVSSSTLKSPTSPILIFSFQFVYNTSASFRVLTKSGACSIALELFVYSPQNTLPHTLVFSRPRSLPFSPKPHFSYSQSLFTWPMTLWLRGLSRTWSLPSVALSQATSRVRRRSRTSGNSTPRQSGDEADSSLSPCSRH